MYYLRLIIGSWLQVKVINMQIFQFQFYIGFILLDIIVLKFIKFELDVCDVLEKYFQLFQVILDVELQFYDKVIDLIFLWEYYCIKDVNFSIFFFFYQEY